MGQGQTWQDVTAQRAAGTTYTNNTGRDIMWFLRLQNGPGTYTVTISGLAFSGLGSTGTSGGGNAQTFIVPANATYSLGAGSPLGQWLELRT